MERERSYFIRDLIVKILLVLLFVFLLMWLIPMPNMKPLYDKVFSQNVSTMTNAAKAYYNTTRLPQEEGETKKLTLRDMLNNKMIIEFTDSDGKTCNPDASYVEVTKQGKEYVFKTNLSCSSQSDYVIEYFGCYNVCEDGKCETKIEDNGKKDVIEYEFTKKVTTKFIDKYVCKAGYTLEGNKCVKSSTTTEVNANLKCINGYNYNNSTKMCEKTNVTTIDATKVCPTGYEKQGNTCVKGSENTVPAKVVYTCTKGTLVNDKCVINETKTENPKITYTCKEGTLSGDKCIIKNTQETNANVEYYCPNGTLKGNKCVITNTFTEPDYISHYYCERGTMNSDGKTCKIQKEQTCSYTEWACSNRSYNYTVDTTSTDTFTRSYLYKLGNKYVYEECSRTYSCSGGGTMNVSAVAVRACHRGTRNAYTNLCTVTETKEENAQVKYSCKTGTLNGTKCITQTTTTAYAKANYSCEKGYLTGNNVCAYTQTTTNNANKSYVCDAGTLEGTMCRISGVNTTNMIYACNYGTLKGNKCEIYSKDTKEPTYYCEAGYTLAGNKCYGSTNSEVIDAQIVYGTKTDTAYRWSTKETLEGWTRTGRTRTSGVSVTSRY